MVTEALQLRGQAPRSVSVGLLNAIPEGAPIIAPRIPKDNEATLKYNLYAVDGTLLPIGAVFQVPRVGGATTYYVVLEDGVAEITSTMADVLRFKRTGSAAVPTVAPESLAQLSVPTVEFDSSTLPAEVPQLVTSAADPVLCASWDSATPDSWTIGAAAAMPGGLPLVDLAGTSSQAQVSQVSIAPGSGAVVSDWVPGQQASQITKLYLVNDVGVAFPVASNEVLAKLGFSTTGKTAPKALLDLLPRGAVLDVKAAEQLWDSFPDQMMSGSTLQQTTGVTETAPIGEATAPVTLTAPTS